MEAVLQLNLMGDIKTSRPGEEQKGGRGKNLSSKGNLHRGLDTRVDPVPWGTGREKSGVQDQKQVTLDSKVWTQRQEQRAATRGRTFGNGVDLIVFSFPKAWPLCEEWIRRQQD